MGAVVAGQVRGHGRELAAEKQVQQQCLDGVVSMVAKRDLVAGEFVRQTVQHGPAKPGAHRARCLSLADRLFHDRVGILANDVVPKAACAKPGGQR